MKFFITCFVALLIHFISPAQQILPLAKPKKSNIFRPTYISTGANLPYGNFRLAPVSASNAKDNMLNGHFGAKPGYLFELGTKIYFNNASHHVRYGLDWTFLSLSYNDMDWDIYASGKNGNVVNAMVASASTRLGPVVSYNIIRKLVADVHFQVAPVLQYSSFDYYKQSGASVEEFYFDRNKITSNYGLKTSAGAGIRWGVIGLSADYFSGSVYANYYYINSASGEGTGADMTALKKKISSAAFQLKLSLHF